MNAREEGYCDSAEWKQFLADCLKCANQYELWPDYGQSVEAAAKGCGIDAVPSDAAAEATPSSAAAVSTVSADNLETMPTFVDASTPAAAPGSSETSAIIVTPAESSTVVATQSVVTTAPSASTAVCDQCPLPSLSVRWTNFSKQAATDAPVTATVSGAASNMFSGVLVLGAALLAAVNMM